MLLGARTAPEEPSRPAMYRCGGAHSITGVYASSLYSSLRESSGLGSRNVARCELHSFALRSQNRHSYFPSVFLWVTPEERTVGT